MQLSRRQWLTGSAALAGTLAAQLQAAEAAATVPLHLVHPELRALLPIIEKFDREAPPLTRANLAEVRKPMSFVQKPLDSVPFEKRLIPVGGAHPDVAIYIVNARPGTSRPAILHTHGGGYVSGSAENSVRGLQEICAKLDCVAVSVDYRLAPETTFRGSVEDNYAGLKWLHTNAAALGADPTKIAVMGESAGGGHAALLAIAARDRGEVAVCFQCLIDPMLDDRTGALGRFGRTPPPHVGKIGWGAAKNRFGWESFLGVPAGSRSVPAEGVPARLSDLKGLPPAFIGVGSLDLFYDEDVDFAQRLNAAGVSTELIAVQGAFHAFDAISLMARVPLGTWFENTKLNALRRGFGLPAV